MIRAGKPTTKSKAYATKQSAMNAIMAAIDAIRRAKDAARGANGAAITTVLSTTAAAAYKLMHELAHSAPR